MRTLVRNKRPFSYCTYKETVKEKEDGLYTGEKLPIYNEAVTIYGNISPAKGEAQTEQFGNSLDYEKVIVIDDINTPIDENTVLFIDKDIEYKEGSPYEYEPLYDYVVKKVARSLNSVSIAIAKVEMS